MSKKIIWIVGVLILTCLSLIAIKDLFIIRRVDFAFDAQVKTPVMIELFCREESDLKFKLAKRR